ncbi:MAG: hydantoinase/oxoprolinase family protein [Sporomusaceae bacterium]|nr:hydantoinase/oxoprolinase family protein [Sporomusaceae bacterium]
MWLGIDVGGTFTDAVLVSDRKIVAKSKAATTHQDLLQGVLTALDAAIAHIAPEEISRVALSTTVVTNAIVENRLDPVQLVLMPGPGMNTEGLFPVKPYVAAGYVDHRGRVAMKPEQTVLLADLGPIAGKSFAVAGKFAVRNPVNEECVVQWLREKQAKHVTAASTVSGSLNFVRRANAAYYNAACYDLFNAFADSVEAALGKRSIAAPVHILKADGGTLPLAVARKSPVEAVFTGPSASVLGIMALAPEGEDAISLDIGGTTTDIALWRKGQALFAQRGAKIAGYATSVRAFRLRSVGIGGDSYVRRESGEMKVGPVRKGPPIAVGGHEPTLSDAMIAAKQIVFGNEAAACQAIMNLAIPGQSLSEVAAEIMNVAAATIQEAIAATIAEEELQPVYTVNDLIHPDPFTPKTILGVGGAAAGLIPTVAKQFALPYLVPEYAEIANAVGAAVSRPTMALTLRADTAASYYTIPELMRKEKIDKKNFSLADAQKIAREELARQAAAAGMDASNIEEVYQEEFNMIRGFQTVGKMISCREQIKPGVLLSLQRQKEAGSHE